MKALAALLVSCFISVNLFSQDTTSRLSYGIHITPQISNRIHIIPPHYENKYDHFKYIQPKLGWSVGGIVEVQLSRRFILQTGVSLSNKGFAANFPLEYFDSISSYCKLPPDPQRL